MKKLKISYIFVVVIACVFLGSCLKEKTSVSLRLLNCTQDTLCFESNVVSPTGYYCSNCRISDPDEDWYTIIIAESDDFSGHIDYKLDMGDLISNKDEASVKIYLLRNGNKELVKEWTYAKRNEPGRQLFNEKFFSEPYKRVERNYLFYSYVFDILPEDIGK